MTRYIALEPGRVTLCESAEQPVPPGYARIAVAACGVCGTDVHLLEGAPLPPGVSYPLRPGHEVAGVVSEVGDGVAAAISVGTPVVLHPLAPCGACVACRSGREERCRRPAVLGIDRPGGLATDVVWPAARMLPVPGVSLEQAAILADAVATAKRALDLAALPHGGRLCVLGAGGVGTHVLELARLADPVSELVGVVRSKSSAARLEGAGFAASTGLDWEGLRRPGGYDAVVDFSGDPAAPAFGLRLLGVAGRFVFGSVLDGPLDLGSAQRVQTRELTVAGVYASSLDDLRAVVDLLVRGDLDLSRSVTHRFELAQHAELFATVRSRPPGLVRAAMVIP